MIRLRPFGRAPVRQVRTAPQRRGGLSIVRTAPYTVDFIRPFLADEPLVAPARLILERVGPARHGRAREQSNSSCKNIH